MSRTAVLPSEWPPINEAPTQEAPQSFPPLQSIKQAATPHHSFVNITYICMRNEKEIQKATRSFAEVDDEVTAWRLWLQTIKKQQRQFAVNCIHHCVKTRIPPTGTNKHWPGSSITSTKNYIPWALATSSAPYGVTLFSRFHFKARHCGRLHTWTAGRFHNVPVLGGFFGWRKPTLFPVCHYGSLVFMKSLGFQSETLYSTHLKVLSPTVLLVAADRHSKQKHHSRRNMTFRSWNLDAVCSRHY